MHGSSCFSLVAAVVACLGSGLRAGEVNVEGKSFRVPDGFVLSTEAHAGGVVPREAVVARWREQLGGALASTTKTSKKPQHEHRRGGPPELSWKTAGGGEGTKRATPSPAAALERAAMMVPRAIKS